MISRLAILAVLATAAPAAAHAETLFDAIRLAYQSNPTLRAQRADLRATDEAYVQARAGYGVQINATGQIQYQRAEVDPSPGISGHIPASEYSTGAGAADVTLVQPIYTFGAARAAVNGASANISAGRQTLRDSEARLIQAVVTAYVDVRRDRQTVAILQDEIVALRRVVAETTARGKLGQLTKTDVAEAQARLLSAEAQLNLAQGRLNASNAAYLNTIGQSPGELDPEPDLAGMPKTVDEAFDAADQNNPQLLAAMATERAAREKVNQARSANGPTVSVKVDGNVSPVLPYVPKQYDRSVTVAAVFTQPLYTSGMNSSKIREALEQDNKAQMQIEAARREVVQLVSQAWSQLVFNRKAMAIETEQLKVEQVSVEGNRIEERVWFRRTIDLLNAELELAETRLNLVQSRHDEYVARAGLLAAMGVLEARFLTPGVETYEPTTSLKRVKDRGAPPWESTISQIDTLATPKTSPPRVTSKDGVAPRPSDLPPLPPQPQ